MGKLKLNIKKEALLSDNDYLKYNYKTWRESSKESNQNFYILPHEFKEYLPLIHTSAINLYMFYCLHSKNEGGDSWYSLESLSKELGASTKSINNWNKELENLGLIYREKNTKKSSTTFLLPITDYIQTSEKSVDEYIMTSNKNFDGELISIMHIFQWRSKLSKNNKKRDYSQPFNRLVLCYQRTHHIDEKTIKIRKFVVLEPEFLKVKKIDLSSTKFKDDVYVFESDLSELQELSSKYDVNIHGLAIRSKHNLEKKDEFLEILQELTEELSDITTDNFSSVNLI